MKRAYRAAVSSVLLLVLAAPGHAQSPPPASQPFPGFVSPYEVMRMVHASGFDPLAPPLREGTAYVLRATDFRGILMRVVVDGRTGAFREVTRIVPGPGRYGQFYGGPPYGPSEYDAMAAPMAAPPGVESEPALARPAVVHPAITSTVPAIALSPPLPRPRPAALASRSPADVKPAASPEPAVPPKAEATTSTAPPSTAPVTTAPANSTATTAKPAAPPDGKPQVNSEVVTAPPPPAAAPRKSAIPAEPLND